MRREVSDRICGVCQDVKYAEVLGKEIVTRCKDGDVLLGEVWTSQWSSANSNSFQKVAIIFFATPGRSPSAMGIFPIPEPHSPI